MRPSNSDIGIILEKGLSQHSGSVLFESVWNVHLQHNRKTINSKKQTAIILVLFITVFAISTGAFAAIKMRKVDNTNYPFVNDPEVIGKWEYVDFVQNANDFAPGQSSWRGDLFLTSLAFIKQGEILSSIENGNLAFSTLTWTKSKVLNQKEKTASEYTIRDINGASYMFLEWKNGDYIFKDEKPWYYVFKKADGKDYSNYQVARIEDKIDYPFIDDSDMKGKWESVDSVKTIDLFTPGVRNWTDELFVVSLNVQENGKLTLKTTSSESSGSSLTWTKGLIINKEARTASKCEVKEINGEVYLFYEWKSGEYIYRGMAPYYYVLKKIQ